MGLYKENLLTCDVDGFAQTLLDIFYVLVYFHELLHWIFKVAIKSPGH